MFKNITLSAEEKLIQLARERAAQDNTSLNAEFRRWLEKYVKRPESAAAYSNLMAQFDYVQPGQKFTREEMNER
ncbi:MAG: hypothetical protein ISS57_11320 [Anaerolineales bacterium]|nr:hypothetical protein [Anaerolineales bacterium]